jgi:hypothetical protein
MDNINMKSILIILMLLPVPAFGQMVKTGVVTTRVVAAALSNMISNGTFDDGTDWGIISNWTIGSGVASYDDVSSGYLYQTPGNMVVAIEANTAYTLEFDISISSGNARILFGEIGASVDYIVAANYINGHHAINFTTPANIGSGGFLIQGIYQTTDNPFTIDNITLVLQ